MQRRSTGALWAGACYHGGPDSRGLARRFVGSFSRWRSGSRRSAGTGPRSEGGPMNEEREVPRPPSRSSRRKRWIAGTAVVGGLVILAIGVWVWRRPRPPEPPVLDLSQVDPEVAEAITEARQEVVRRPFSGP